MNNIARFLMFTPFLPWLIVGTIALIWEGLYPGDRGQPWRGKILNMVNGLVLCVMIFFFLPIVHQAAFFASRLPTYGFMDLQFFPGHDVGSQILSAILLLFFGDVLFCFWHRAEHTHAFLWGIHAVHHSETSLNATTYLRQNWLEPVSQNLLIGALAMSLFRLTPITLSALVLGMSFLLFFAHMNVRMQLGRYSWVLTGPQLHRLHHSMLPEHRNSNYAQYFPLIDIIFGTYVAPKPNEFPPTGLDSGERVESLLTAFLWPFRKWFYSLKTAFHL